MTKQPNDDPSVDNKTGQTTRTGQTPWGLVIGASLISTGLAAYEIVPASVTPLIRDSLNIGPTVAGLLVGDDVRDCSRCEPSCWRNTRPH